MSEHASLHSVDSTTPPLALTSEPLQALANRPLHTRINRKVAAMLAGTSLLLGGVTPEANTTEDPLTYTVTNAPDGIYSRSSPHIEDTPRIDGQGTYDGDSVQLLCGFNGGDPVGDHNNTLWHKVRSVDRPEQPSFWINDYYVTSDVADRVPGKLAPWEPACDENGILQSAEPTPEPQEPKQQQKGCYFNLKWLKRDLTFSYEGGKRYYKNAAQAAKNWTDLDAGFTIKPAPEGEEGDIVFKDVYITNSQSDRAPYYGRAAIDELIGNENSFSNPPTSPRLITKGATIYINQYTIEDYFKKEFRINDKGRTYTITHELGHILGLAHPDHIPNVKVGEKACALNMDSTRSIMKEGSKYTNVSDLPFSTPQPYDKMALEKLYSKETPEEVRIKKIWQMLSKIFPFFGSSLS